MAMRMQLAKHVKEIELLPGDGGTIKYKGEWALLGDGDSLRRWDGAEARLAPCCRINSDPSYRSPGFYKEPPENARRRALCGTGTTQANSGRNAPEVIKGFGKSTNLKTAKLTAGNEGDLHDLSVTRIFEDQKAGREVRSPQSDRA
jgi:hypothetical protein